MHPPALAHPSISASAHGASLLLFITAHKHAQAYMASSPTVLFYLLTLLTVARRPTWRACPLKSTACSQCTWTSRERARRSAWSVLTQISSPSALARCVRALECVHADAAHMQLCVWHVAESSGTLRYIQHLVTQQALPQIPARVIRKGSHRQLFE